MPGCKVFKLVTSLQDTSCCFMLPFGSHQGLLLKTEPTLAGVLERGGKTEVKLFS